MTTLEPTAAFPRQRARTRGFSLGVPRDFTVSPDGTRVAFLRSRTGNDPWTCLWQYDVASGEERLVVGPDQIGGGPEDDVPEAERVRRERTRERAGGVVGYATDEQARLACFGLAGRLWVASLTDSTVRELPAAGPVIDPRVDRTGTWVAYVTGGAMRACRVDGTEDRPLAEPEHADVTYGLAEHVAAESMHRVRGYWWAPDSSRLLVARVDTSRVTRWYVADPAHPDRAPREMAYPPAGTTNAEVTLSVVGLDGARVDVDWDREAFEYLVEAVWSERGLLIAVESRDQKTVQVRAVDPDTGSTRLVREIRDRAWVNLTPGAPALTEAGELVTTADLDGARHLVVGEHVVTPPGLQVREVAAVDGDGVLFTASEDPTEVHLWQWSPTSGLSRLSAEPGLHKGWRAGGTTVLLSETLSAPGATVHVLGNGASGRIRSVAEEPVLRPRVELMTVGEQALRVALVLPSWYEPGSGPLPVLMDPYGGPAAQRVIATSRSFLVSQWFAEHGFAVVVVDGRGTPGRGPDWERTVYLSRLAPVLDDQVAGLHAVAERLPDLDLGRVGIRGWSYGGYLAAAAVLRRPDVFHAAVAGAPVTDHRLYDTHWQERFLGHPDEHAELYDGDSLIGDAPRLERPLLLVHGLADDNVVAAHTLRLSAALLAAGRPHTVLPLPGATHMVSDEQSMEGLMRLELDFLTRALGVAPPPLP